MERPTGPIIELVPGGAPPDEAQIDGSWDEAYAMVEAYYGALRMRNRLLLSRIIAIVLRRAARRLPNEPGRTPAELAMAEAMNVIAEWFKRVMNLQVPERHLAARGRLALLLADVPGKWQRWFLVDSNWPDEFLAQMRSSYLAAGPAFQTRTMMPQALDLPDVVTAANEGWEALGQRPWTRKLIGLGILLAIASSIGLLLWE